MTEYPLLCQSPHCRPADHGGPRRTNRAWVCDVCIDRAREQLGWGWTDKRGRHQPGIAEMWPDLQDNLARAERTADPDQGHQKNGGKAHGTGLNEAVSEAMRAATAHIWFLTRVTLDLADEDKRTLRLPSAQDTPSLAGWLADWHVDALVSRPGMLTALAIIEDTASIHTQVRRAAYPSGARKVETGMACTEHTTTPDGARTPCPGAMVAWVHTGMDHTPDLVCTEDDTHRVDPATWQRAGWKARHAPTPRTYVAQ